MADARPSPPWIFAVTILPFAAAVGYVTIAAPYWLATRGVSLAAIGAMSGLALAPHGLKVLWAPLIDLGPRKLWFLGTTLITAVSVAALALLPAPERNLPAFTALALVANVAGTTACAAADGLMAVTTAPDQKGRAAGWRMAGNVGGTGVLGALVLWVAARSTVPLAGLGLAVIVLASALATLRIREPRSSALAAEGAPAVQVIRRRLAEMAQDLWATMRSREGWSGVVICLMPVGAGALTNLFSAMGPEYQASEDRVALVNGLWGGLVGAAGSFVGGWLADRMNRRLAYALAGEVTAATALAMLAGPLTPLTFTWGTLGYNFANGIAFAALAAFILEMVGAQRRRGHQVHPLHRRREPGQLLRDRARRRGLRDPRPRRARSAGGRCGADADRDRRAARAGVDDEARRSFQP